MEENQQFSLGGAKDLFDFWKLFRIFSITNDHRIDQIIKEQKILEAREQW